MFAVIYMYSESKPEIHQSRTLFDTQNPKWETKFEFEVYDNNMVMTKSVKDLNTIRYKFLAK